MWHKKRKCYRKKKKTLTDEGGIRRKRGYRKERG